MRYLSLFSGIESCTVAWQPLGFTCIGFSEIDPFCCELLSYHYPDTPNLGDISGITETMIKALGVIDVIVFGSPCQDLSMAGKRQGLKGERSGLFNQAMQIIRWARKHNQLRFALWENVPGAFSSNEGQDFAAVVGQMAGLSKLEPPKGKFKNTGFALGEHLIEWRVLDAQYFGVPQRRKRVFALADFGNWQDRPPILLECQGVFGNIDQSKSQKQTPTTKTYSTAHRPSQHAPKHVCYGVIADITPKFNDNLVGTLRATGGGGITPPLVAYDEVYALDARQSLGSQKQLAYTLCATDYKGVQAVYAIAGNIIGRSDRGQEAMVLGCKKTQATRSPVPTATPLATPKGWSDA